MSKIMSMLEKYNLVEKINKEEEIQANLNEATNILLDEKQNGESGIINVQASYDEEEINETKSVIKEKPLGVNSDLEYQNKMTLNEIYSLYKLEYSNINTVFMLQNLINALPQDLPKEVIKQSVIKIINASNIDLNELIFDGEQRQEILFKVIDKYSNQTNKYVDEYKEEITKLSKLISNYQEQIQIKETMLEEQMHIINYEANKINGIIDFFSK